MKPAASNYFVQNIHGKFFYETTALSPCSVLKDERSGALFCIIVAYFVKIFDTQDGILFQPK